jgi:hypothetical protein
MRRLRFRLPRRHHERICASGKRVAACERPELGLLSRGAADRRLAQIEPSQSPSLSRNLLFWGSSRLSQSPSTPSRCGKMHSGTDFGKVGAPDACGYRRRRFPTSRSQLGKLALVVSHMVRALIPAESLAHLASCSRPAWPLSDRQSTIPLFSSSSQLFPFVQAKWGPPNRRMDEVCALSLSCDKL